MRSRGGSAPSICSSAFIDPRISSDSIFPAQAAFDPRGQTDLSTLYLQRQTDLSIDLILSLVDWIRNERKSGRCDRCEQRVRETYRAGACETWTHGGRNHA